MSQDWIGDVDGDGVSDLIVSSPLYSISPLQFGVVFLYSGKSGALLDSITAAFVPSASSFGLNVSRLGDVTGDGIPEVAIGQYPGGGSGLSSVMVFSVLPFRLVYEAFAPQLQSGLGAHGFCGGTDLNGDGWPDLVAGDYDYYEAGVWVGAVHALDGLDGSLLWRTTGTYIGQSYGQTVACPGDLNGDGYADVLTRSYDGLGGAVHVLSGVDGSEMYRVEGENWLSFIGLGRLAGCGDADGDGLPDFIAGQDEVPGVNRGVAIVYRGYDGAILHRWEGKISGERFGATVAGPGDLDGDGIPDFAVGAPNASPFSEPGKIYVYTGRDFSLLKILKSPAGPALENYFGWPIASSGADLNGDGAVELLTADVNEPAGGVFGAGTSYVITFDKHITADARALSASSGGTIRFRLDFPASEAGRRYRLLASEDLPGWITLGGVAIPLVVTPLLRQMVYAPSAALDHPRGVLDADGDATVTATLPPQALAAFVGRTLKFAAISETAPGQPSLSSAAVWVEVLP